VYTKPSPASHLPSIAPCTVGDDAMVNSDPSACLAVLHPGPATVHSLVYRLAGPKNGHACSSAALGTYKPLGQLRSNRWSKVTRSWMLLSVISRNPSAAWT
jgi:hypothetical protein